VADAAPATEASAAADGEQPDADEGGGRSLVGSSRCAAINGKLTRSTSNKGVLNLVEKNFETLNAVNLATALHRLASINKKRRSGRDAVLRDARFKQLLSAMVEHSQELTARSVSDMLWSLATLQHWPSWMLVPVLTAVNTELDKGTFEAHHLTTTTWALAKLETKPVRLLEKIEAQVTPKLPTLGMQNLAQLLWGLATLKYEPTALLPALAPALTGSERLAKAKPVELATIAFALGELTQPGSDACDDACEVWRADVLVELARVAAPGSAVLARFSSRQLVTMISVYAKLNAVSALPEGQMDAWVAFTRKAHEARPLTSGDSRTLEAALDTLGINKDWVKRSEILNEWIQSVDGVSGQRRVSRVYTEEELVAAFNAIDTDKSGDIDLDELRTAIRAIKTSSDDAAVEQMIAIADEDGSGTIDFEEFRLLMSMRRRAPV